MFRWFGLLFVIIPLVVHSQVANETLKKEEISDKKAPLEESSKEKTQEGETQEEKTQEGETQEEKTQEKDYISIIQNYLKPMIYNRETRDPFEKPAIPLKMGQIYGPFLETQNYNLDGFILKGLIWKATNPRAIFQGPGNKEYRLTVKDHIGENFGYIATIREREVVIIQTIEENNKRYSTTKVVFLKNE